MTHITELASIIATNTQIVNDYFQANNFPTPSFSPAEGPPHIHIPSTETKVAAAHSAVISATAELHELMRGPMEVLTSMEQLNDTLSLQTIYRYDIASTFPVDGEATFEEISEKCGLNLIDLKRILRHAMTNWVFVETEEGKVRHTIKSSLLAGRNGFLFLKDFVGIEVEERFLAAARTVDALAKYGHSQDPSQSGFSLGHNTPNGLYSELRLHPDRGTRFAGAMSAFATKVPLAPLAEHPLWSSLPQNSQIVDVAGGWGPVSIGLAKFHPHLKFMVQDFSDVIVGGPDQVKGANLSTGKDGESRVEFMAYDIMKEEQPVKGAAVYFFRAVFHNWPDKSCTQILKNHVPAMREGSRIVINEQWFPEPGSLPWQLERRRRSADLAMLSYFGSRERVKEDWIEILRDADPRFEFKSATTTEGNGMVVIEVGWNS